MHRQHAIQKLSQPSRYGESQAGAWLLLFGDLHELLEDARDVVLRYSHSLIDYLYLYTSILILFARNPNRLPFAELDRVRQQVEQDLPHPPRITDDVEGLSFHVQTQRRAVLVGQGPNGDE